MNRLQFIEALAAASTGVVINFDAPVTTHTNTAGTVFYMVTTSDGDVVGIHSESLDQFNTDVDDSGLLPDSWRIAPSGVLHKRTKSNVAPWLR